MAETTSGDDRVGNEENSGRCPDRVLPDRRDDDAPKGPKRGRGPAHQRIARHLIDVLGASESGWRIAIEAAIGEPGPGDIIIPDAFHIHVKAKEVWLHEVEVWHALDARKKGKIARWARWLRSHGWTARLFEYDKRGQRVEFDPLTGQLAESELEKVRAVMAQL
jgi:hypothetical protein